MDQVLPAKWGEIHFYKNYTKAIVYKPNSNREYHINIFDNHILVDLKIENKILLSFGLAWPKARLG